METGTLRDLNVKPGDVVECVVDGHRRVVGNPAGTGFTYADDHGDSLGTITVWRLVSRASDTPKTWAEMTDAEKGALLLAHHEGKVIEVMIGDLSWKSCDPSWCAGSPYRIKPAPKRETVTIDVRLSSFGKWYQPGSVGSAPTHSIAFDTLDGEPVTGTYRDDEGNEVRIERIGQ